MLLELRHIYDIKNQIVVYLYEILKSYINSYSSLFVEKIHHDYPAVTYNRSSSLFRLHTIDSNNYLRDRYLIPVNKWIT